MSATRTELARTGMRSALNARQKGGIISTHPVAIYDLVEKLGVEAWFVGGTSFSGMFVKGLNRVFIPSERPAGRKAFTCAHEFGHWNFGHGSRVESLDFDKADHEIPEEYLSNIFAANLLMPRRVVIEEFKRRGVIPSKAGCLTIYSVACQLTVGYESLLQHMCRSLRLISITKMKELLKVRPKDIRTEVLGYSTPNHLVLADQFWHVIPIDLEVGDYATIPRGARFNSNALITKEETDTSSVIEAKKEGIIQVIAPGKNGWSVMVRVSRKKFVGRGKFRHLEDPDEL